MSIIAQYIVIALILGCVIAWVIYRLTRKDKGNVCNCGNCSDASECKVKEVMQRSQKSKENRNM